MLLYLFFDSLLLTCQKKMDTEKWPKATDSPLLTGFFMEINTYTKLARIPDPYRISFSKASVIKSASASSAVTPSSLSSTESSLVAL